jgi:uncharacterized membrane protein (UPF0127 family)
MLRSTLAAVLKSAALALFLFQAYPSAAAQAVTADQSMRFASEPLVIRTARGERHKFTVELALTDRQREYGLMFRTAMPADHGMLFDFGVSRRVMMWMENTPLPLDMLFLDKSGVITRIHENAEPYSRAIIDSQSPVRYVIELNGGAAAKLGLATGDTATSATIEKGSRK